MRFLILAAAQPLFPLAKTLADINMDALNVNGRTVYFWTIPIQQ